jgi:hypothetical protein
LVEFNRYEGDDQDFRVMDAVKGGTKVPEYY